MYYCPKPVILPSTGLPAFTCPCQMGSPHAVIAVALWSESSCFCYCLCHSNLHIRIRHFIRRSLDHLVDRGLNKMIDIWQTTYSDSLYKGYSRLNFHWSLFLGPFENTWWRHQVETFPALLALCDLEMMLLSEPILVKIHHAVWFRYKLTHCGRDKMAANFLTTFSSSFSWMKMYEFRLSFHWSLFLRFQLTISRHWFR